MKLKLLLSIALQLGSCSFNLGVPDTRTHPVKLQEVVVHTPSPVPASSVSDHSHSELLMATSEAPQSSPHSTVTLDINQLAQQAFQHVQTLEQELQDTRKKLQTCKTCGNHILTTCMEHECSTYPDSCNACNMCTKASASAVCGSLSVACICLITDAIASAVDPNREFMSNPIIQWIMISSLSAAGIGCTTLTCGCARWWAIASTQDGLKNNDMHVETLDKIASKYEKKYTLESLQKQTQEQLQALIQEINNDCDQVLKIKNRGYSEIISA